MTDSDRIEALEKTVADLTVKVADMKLVQSILIDHIAPENCKPLPRTTLMGPCGQTMSTIPHKGDVR